MGTLKIKGQTSGSVSLKAPDTGSDAILTLPGTTGELLPLAGGKILQIVRATDSTERSTTSTSATDVTGMSVTITPQKSDSAIIIASIFYAQVTGTSGDRGVIFILADSSNNELSGGELLQLRADAVLSTRSYLNIWGYATPATTSAVTYKLRFAVITGSTGSVRNDVTTGQMYAIEVSA